MRKEVVIVCLIVCLFLFSGANGCATLPINQDGKQVISQFSKQTTSVVSDKGIVVSFLEDMPPLDEFIVDEPFQVGLRFENYLETPMNVNFKIYDTLADNVIYDERMLTLEGGYISDGKFVPYVEEVFLPYDEGYYIYEVEKETRTHIVVELEASYSVESDLQFCAKQKNFDLTECSDDETWGSGDLDRDLLNNPVGVSSITKEIRHLGVEGDKAKAILEFDIENLGGGEINQDSINNLKVETLSYGEFNCRVERQTGESIKLIEGEISVRCDKDFDFFDAPVVQDPLTLSYDYGYKIKEFIGPIDIILSY